MKDLLKRALARIESWLVNEAEAESIAAAMRYQRQAFAMSREEQQVVRTVPRDQAMRLQAGSPYQTGHTTYRVDIHDRNDGSRFGAPIAPFAAMGYTAAHAKARAEQLISALDGARRL